MGKKQIAITLDEDITKDMEKVREVTGLPISTQIELRLKGFAIVSISKKAQLIGEFEKENQLLVEKIAEMFRKTNEIILELWHQLAGDTMPADAKKRLNDAKMVCAFGNDSSNECIPPN